MFWGRRGMHAHAGGEVQHSGKGMRRMWMTGCAMCTAVYGALALLLTLKAHAAHVYRTQAPLKRHCPAVYRWLGC